MCGIAYAENFDGKPVNTLIFDQYMAQQHRGTEGFGLFNGEHLFKAAKEVRIVNWLAKKKNESPLILFHHRWPTSTINVKQAAHPFTTKNYFGNTQYILVHNGWVSNAEALFTKHQELGIEYQSLLRDLTFNDSESLLWDLALTLEGKQDKLQEHGDTAFICLKTVGGVLDKMYFGRNMGRPLNFERTKHQIVLSSEGDGDITPVNELYTWNYKLKRLTHRKMQFNMYAPYVPSAYSGVHKANALARYRAEDWDGYAPASTVLRDVIERRYEVKHIEDFVPAHTQSAIENEAMGYLLLYEGVFDQAYNAMERDYELDLDEAEMTGSYDKVTLLEGAMEYLTYDPEYINERSVSSDWRAVCKQMTI